MRPLLKRSVLVGSMSKDWSSDRTESGEYQIRNDDYVITQDSDGFYHISMNDRQDIHGPMDSDALFNWMSNVIHNLSHLLGKFEKN